MEKVQSIHLMLSYFPFNPIEPPPNQYNHHLHNIRIKNSAFQRDWREVNVYYCTLKSKQQMNWFLRNTNRNTVRTKHVDGGYVRLEWNVLKRGSFPS